MRLNLLYPLEGRNVSKVSNNEFSDKLLNTSFIQPIIPLTFNDFSHSLGISLAFQFHFWWERKRNAIDAIAAVLKLR
jgi:hypothetical protein